MSTAPAAKRGHPKIIIIHVGRNNIDSGPQLILMQSIKDDLKYIHLVFSSSMFVWCESLPRLFRRNNKSEDSKTLNLKSKRINRTAHQYMTDFGLGQVLTPHLLWYCLTMMAFISDFGKLICIQTFRN